MNKDTLDRLVPVDLREVWTHEASDFTPWLAREENLTILGEALGIELELEAQEKTVGPFRADILCKDVDNGDWVLVENQLERTNHVHLGQLLTYASGLEAVTIVWIAAHFTEEHRSTLDWLNKITDDHFRFFGLEVELWRIGNSSAAPKFNVVAKPNDWSRSIAQAARTIDESGLTPLRQMQREYWSAFMDVLNKAGGPVSGNRTPGSRSYMNYPIGRTGFTLSPAITRTKERIFAELYIKGKNAKRFFYLLREQKDEIESELGYELEFKELPEKQASRITVYKNSINVEDREDWKHQHEWLAKKLNELHRVFSPRVRGLDPEDWDD